MKTTKIESFTELEKILGDIVERLEKLENESGGVELTATKSRPYECPICGASVNDYRGHICS